MFCPQRTFPQLVIDELANKNHLHTRVRNFCMQVVKIVIWFWKLRFYYSRFITVLRGSFVVSATSSAE